MNTLHNCIQTGDTSSNKSYITTLSRYAVGQNIIPSLIMSSYVVTHMKNSSPTGGDDSMNACGNLDMLTSHIAVRMLAMVCAVMSSLTMMSVFLNGSVTTNAKKNYIRLSQTATRSNQTFFCYSTLSGHTGVPESDALIIIIIIQRLQSHALPDRPTDRQERKQHPDPISHFFAIRTDRPTDRNARERRAL